MALEDFNEERNEIHEIERYQIVTNLLFFFF